MQQSIILVHGIWMTGLELGVLAWRLRRRGYRTYLFHYHSLTQPLDKAAEALGALVARVPGERVHLLGHSMGGLLICRYLAAQQPERPARLGRVVALGSPFNGSAVARALRASAWKRWLVGVNGELLGAGLGAAKPPCELGVIAGDNPLGVGRLLATLPEPHDGTVTVAETRLAAAQAHLVLPYSHFSLLLSARVADEVERFLQHGRFVTGVN